MIPPLWTILTFLAGALITLTGLLRARGGFIYIGAAIQLSAVCFAAWIQWADLYAKAGRAAVGLP